jgi:hypothetical protein
MNTAIKALGVMGFLLGNALSACGGQVLVNETETATVEAAVCESCSGTATVELAGLAGLEAAGPDLNIDLCVGVSCGQALVSIMAGPFGSYPAECTANGDELGCCFSSPPATMPSCSAVPQGPIVVTMTLPLRTAPGTTLGVTAYVETMQGEPLGALDGDVYVESCGEGCITGEAVLD